MFVPYVVVVADLLLSECPSRSLAPVDGKWDVLPLGNNGTYHLTITQLAADTEYEVQVVAVQRFDSGKALETPSLVAVGRTTPVRRGGRFAG